MTKEERAVILAAMARYRDCLKRYDGDVSKWMQEVRDLKYPPTAARLIRACARLEKRREHAK